MKMSTQVRDYQHGSSVGAHHKMMKHVNEPALMHNQQAGFQDQEVISGEQGSGYYYSRAPSSYIPVKVDLYDKFYEPVIRPFSPFNPDEDAKALQKAMKGMGTNEKAIIDILTRRSNSQRQQIAKQYQTLFKKDLIKDLKSELSGTLEEVILGLMQTPEVFDAHSIHKAVAGLGTDEKALIEIIGSRTFPELYVTKREYKAAFKNDLEKDIIGDTSGFFRDLLLSKLRHSDRVAKEGMSYDIYPKQAYHEAQALWETGPKKWHTDLAFFNPIFSERSDEHLRQVFQDYREIGHIDIEKDIEKELSGDVRDMLLALVKVNKNRPAYFAERLFLAMKGSGVDAKTVVRIIVSRAEKDLGNIKMEYARMYGKSLEDAISGDFSGDAKKVLLGVLSQNRK